MKKVYTYVGVYKQLPNRNILCPYIKVSPNDDDDDDEPLTGAGPGPSRPLPAHHVGPCPLN